GIRDKLVTGVQTCALPILIDCDRVSVAVRVGRKARVEAVSGCDVVEKRSNLVVLMRKLFDSVLAWGEKLVYTGTKDDSLPPDVQIGRASCRERVEISGVAV